MCRRMALAWWVAQSILLAAACQQSVDEGPEGQAKSVEVIWSGQAEIVDLGRLEAVEQAGRQVVGLDDVIQAAFEEVSLQDVTADFVAADGFRPASKSLCRELIPVPGDRLARACLDVETANLLWDDELGYSGCLFVQGVGELRLYALDAEVSAVTVSLGDQKAEVGLDFLPTQVVDGHEAVALRTVVGSSGLSESVDLYQFAFQTAQTSSTDLGLDPVDWDMLANGAIRLDNRSLVWSSLPDDDSTWSLSDVTGILLVDPAGDAASVTVVFGDASAVVKLGELELVQVDGEQLVDLQAVVTASGLTDAPETLVYDFEGADNFRPHAVKGLDALDWPTLSKGWIHPLSASLTWDESLGLPGAWWVSEVIRIHLLTL